MKFDSDTPPNSADTSHTLVVELCGSGRRILDVGCSTGEVAEALTGEGNEVWGVEIDREAADKASGHVVRLVVGDVEQMDLIAEFGRASFDIVVFADVLEHLKDPVAVLRRVRPLLAADGCIIASIPNVAHGAVRLALLKGRFEYRELGLLDDTHLRFFTRASVGQLFDSAGYVPTDVRQTTAGVFETEVSLSPAEFPDGIVDEVERDPDSTTYQFVVRAVPLGAHGEDDAVVAALAERGREVALLRKQLADIASCLSATPLHPVVGLLVGPDRACPAALAGATLSATLAELRRRLTGFEVRPYVFGTDPDGVGLGGDMALPLLPWDAERAARIRVELDAVVVCGDHADPDVQNVTANLADEGLAVFPVAKGPMTISTDPLALAGRLFERSFLDQRAAYLRIVGRLPEADACLLTYIADPAERLAASTVGALETIARRSVLTIVECPDDIDVVDLFALVSTAEFVVTDSPRLAALAAGLGTAALGISSAESGEPVNWPVEMVTGTVDELIGLAEVIPREEQRGGPDPRLERVADAHFDELASALVSASGRRLAQTAPQRLAELNARVAALEAVNAGLRRSSIRERSALMSRVQELYVEAQAAPPPVRSAPRRRLHQELEQLHLEMDRLRAEVVYYRNELALATAGVAYYSAEADRHRGEVDRVYATKTMRTAQPVRRIYGRLRSIFR